MKKGRKGKTGKVINVAEGGERGGGFKVAEKVKQHFPRFDIRVSILGHIQRGGAPSCMERVNASRMGYSAIEGLLKGKKNVMVGIINKEIVFTPLEKVIKHTESLQEDMIKMMEILSA